MLQRTGSTLAHLNPCTSRNPSKTPSAKPRCPMRSHECKYCPLYAARIMQCLCDQKRRDMQLQCSRDQSVEYSSRYGSTGTILCPYLLGSYGYPQYRLSPIVSQLCRKDKILVPQRLKMLSLLLSSEKLLSEEHKEVIGKNTKDHRCLYGIEPLHRQVAESEIFFEFPDGVLIVSIISLKTI